MNILVTGCNGFIGSAVSEYLESIGHTVYATNRQTLNLLSDKEINYFFKTHVIDIVIHAAVAGGRRTRKDTAKDLYENILMFENLAAHSDQYKLFISFGSGAEYDRRLDIWMCEETLVDSSSPNDYYGLAKKNISERMKKHANMVNLRLFGCFGPTESSDRFIKSSIERYIDSEPILIHQDRQMDFFYINDLCKVIEYYIQNYNKEDLPNDLNMCYMEKHTLLDIADEIGKLNLELLGLTKSKNRIIIKKPNYAKSYTGNGKKLFELGFGDGPLINKDKKLAGLRAGIHKTYKELKNGR